MNKNIFAEFEKIKLSEKSTAQFIPYDWHEFPDSVGFEWFVYGEMLTEFSPEISNILNDLINYTFWLKCWDIVISKLDDNEKLDVLHEFINPLVITALNLPYAIKSRFIFAAAHLSHQANRFKDGVLWKDDLPLDEVINFNVADKYCSKWYTYKSLKLAVEKIDNSKYKKNTDDFRNKYNHRFSRRIELGITGLVTRHLDENGFASYSMNALPALKLGEIVKSLEEQNLACYKTFGKFQKLVTEQISCIN